MYIPTNSNTLLVNEDHIVRWRWRLDHPSGVLVGAIVHPQRRVYLRKSAHLGLAAFHQDDKKKLNGWSGFFAWKYLFHWYIFTCIHFRTNVYLRVCYYSSIYYRQRLKLDFETFHTSGNPGLPVPCVFYLCIVIKIWNIYSWLISATGLSKEYYNYLFQVLDTSIPAYPALATTISVLQKLLFQIEKKARDSPSNLQNVKFIELIIQNCDVLIKRKL